jgi:hypothetical protein
MKPLLTILLLPFFLSAYAQDDAALNSTWKDSARFYVKELKQGALLVGLASRAKAIAALQQAGKTKEASEIFYDQRAENREIVSAFRMAFSFCPVYFFFSDSMDAPLAGKKSGYLLNDSLETDHTIIIQESYFMIAQKGAPQKFIPSDQTQPDLEASRQSLLKETIVIYDHQLRQMKAPFPYYAQEPFPGTLSSTNWKSKVETLNKKLISFYRRSWE